MPSLSKTFVILIKLIKLPIILAYMITSPCAEKILLDDNNHILLNTASKNPLASAAPPHQLIAEEKKQLSRQSWDLMLRNQKKYENMHKTPSSSISYGKFVAGLEDADAASRNAAALWNSIKERPFAEKVNLRSPQHMLGILGWHNYDEKFMNWKQPSEACRYPRGRLVWPSVKSQSDDQSSASMTYSNLPKMDYYFGKSRRLRKIALNKRQRLQLRRFLRALTSCPLHSTWRDMGSQYWPRWTRQGACLDTGCSIPQGMRCRDGHRHQIAVLRHVCPVRWRRSKCGWKRIYMNVLIHCECHCRNKLQPVGSTKNL